MGGVPASGNMLYVSIGSGTIEWEEFLPLVAAKMKEQEDEAFYKNLFRMLDKKNKGFVKCDDLKKILYGMVWYGWMID